MRFPLLFRQIHGTAIFNIWVRCHRPPIVSIIPDEPLGRVSLAPGSMPDSSVTIVQARCWDDRGTMQFEAATEADLKVAEEWAQRHRDTPPEAFTWIPEFKSP